MNIIELNHVALLVRDVAATSRFYADVVGLTPLTRPAFPFPGAWFRLGTQQELHLIQEEAAGVEDTRSRRDHYALRVDDIEAAAKHLRAKGATFRGPIVRPDGAHQIFIKDPDGHVIEFCADLPK